MAFACPRCSSQNADGARFCSNCGIQYGTAPYYPAAPPTGYTQPPQQGYQPPATGYQQPAAGYPQQPGYAPPPAGYGTAPYGYPSTTPYYQPAPGAAMPVRRGRPGSAIVAILLVLAVLGGGGYFASRSFLAANPVGSLVSIDTSTPRASPSAVTSAAPTPSSSPQPTPSVQTSPKATPSPAPSAQATPAANGTSVAVTATGVSIKVPAGWTVYSKDKGTIVLAGPSANTILLTGSQPLDPPQSSDALIQKAISDAKAKAPDAAICIPQKSGVTVGGKSGTSVGVCLTYSSGGSGSQSIPAIAYAWVATSPDMKTQYFFILACPKDKFDGLRPQVEGMLGSVAFT